MLYKMFISENSSISPHSKNKTNTSRVQYDNGVVWCSQYLYYTMAILLNHDQISLCSKLTQLCHIIGGFYFLGMWIQCKVWWIFSTAFILWTVHIFHMTYCWMVLTNGEGYKNIYTDRTHHRLAYWDMFVWLQQSYKY